MKKLISCFFILLVGFSCAAYLYFTKPAPKIELPKKLSLKVETKSFTQGSYPATYKSTGVVKSSQHIDLKSSVSGTISYVTDNFLPGHIVKKDELLIRLGDNFYKNEVAKHEAIYAQAKAAYEVEIGKQKIAKEGADVVFRATGKKPQNNSLMMREPQLQHAKSELQKAKSQLDIAKQDLADVEIKSPFNAMVLNRNVNTASVIDKNTLLAELVGVDQYWVEVLVPQDVMPWVTPKDKKILATIHPDDPKRSIQGYVLKVILALDEVTRMGRVIIAVDDPLKLKEIDNWKRSNNMLQQTMLLMLNDYVNVELQGKDIANVIKLPIDYLRANNTVWLFLAGKLVIREVNIVFKDSDYVYIKTGLNPDDKVIITDIGMPVESMHLEDITSSEA